MFAERSVTTEEAEQFAQKYGASYMETSARNAYNIDEIFQKLIDCSFCMRVSNVVIFEKETNRLNKYYDKREYYGEPIKLTQRRFDLNSCFLYVCGIPHPAYAIGPIGFAR